MVFIEYDNSELIQFYKQNGLEFDLEKGYFGNNVRSFILKEQKILIGAVSISIYKGNSYIEAIAVKNEYRKKGYGKKLLEKAISELEKPIFTISKADEFYFKNGFTTDDADIIDEECKTCEEYKKTCFPSVLVYK